MQTNVQFSNNDFVPPDAHKFYASKQTTWYLINKILDLQFCHFKPCLHPINLICIKRFIMSDNVFTYINFPVIEKCSYIGFLINLLKHWQNYWRVLIYYIQSSPAGNLVPYICCNKLIYLLFISSLYTDIATLMKFPWCIIFHDLIRECNSISNCINILNKKEE